MTLLAPWALWFSLVGAAVVALYILKIKRHQQVVPALEFWRQLAGHTKVHSLFQRLKRLLSLLLWMVIAACLVLALGNPMLALGRVKPHSIAVIIDNSASMQAIEVDQESKTRLQLAIDALKDMSSRRPVNDDWLVIEAGREPRVLQPWTREYKAVAQAADALQPFGGEGDLQAAVELASQLLEGKSDPLIVVFSDGAAGALDTLAQGDQRIVSWPIGGSDDNLGITRLAVRRHPQQANHHVLISIANSSSEKVDTQITFEIDGAANSVELLSVEPEGVWEKTIVVDAPQGGVLRATIDRPDALALDNEAYAILQPIRPAVVWLVSPPRDAFFFEQALAAMDPLISVEESLTMSIEQYERVARSFPPPGQGGGQGVGRTHGQNEAPDPDRSADPPLGPLPSREGGTSVPDLSPPDLSPPNLVPPDLIIFNNCAPVSLPAVGRCMLVNAWPSDLPVTDVGMLETPQLFIAPRVHPLTQHLNLNGVRLAEARHVRLQERATVLAHSAEDDPLVFLFEQRDRTALCLAFDVMQSDMPFRNAFPLLLRNAVAFMHTEAPSWLKDDYRIGEPVAPLRPLPPEAGQVELTSMRGDATQQEMLPVRDGRFIWSDTGRSGALRASFGDEASYAAINLTDAGESDIGGSSVHGADPAQRLALSRRVLGTMPWIGLTFAAALLITLEWLTFNYRWTE